MRHIICPQCGERLGGWKLVLVHLIMDGIWKYRCDCGWESPSGRSENSLRNLYHKLFPPKTIYSREKAMTSGAGTPRQYFIAPFPLPKEIGAVFVRYDPIMQRLENHPDGPETDFVMRRDDYLALRRFFAELKRGGEPTLIVNPPRPA